MVCMCVKMRCYRCNSVLAKNDFCKSCGADVTVYKKIVKLSNAYYNMGLAKAQVRDLTGAVELLRRSVRFDKNNINARFDFDDLMDLDEDDMAELEEGIRMTCKMTIRTLEIFYEELEKSNLPDSVKTAILVSKANSK